MFTLIGLAALRFITAPGFALLVVGARLSKFILTVTDLFSPTSAFDAAEGCGFAVGVFSTSGGFEIGLKEVGNLSEVRMGCSERRKGCEKEEGDG
jgi:hypothetical protein